MVGDDLPRIHTKVGALRFNTLEVYILAIPEGFRRIGEVDVGEEDSRAAAEELSCLQRAILHAEVLHIPHASVRHSFEHGVLHCNRVGVPEGVLPLENAVVDGNVTGFFERRFAFAEYAVTHLSVMQAVERAFAGEVLASDCLSCLLLGA